MKNSLKLFSIILIASVSTACTTTSTLNRGLIHQEKIKTVNLNQLDENISIELSKASTTGAIAGGLVGALVGGAIDASVNSKRNQTLQPLLEKINNIDVNKVLKNALEHHLLDGKAFSENVVVDTAYDKSIKKPYLTPILTPSLIISADHSQLTISLNAATAQTSEKENKNRYNSTYTSLQAIDGKIEADKEANIQYWIDNPVILKEKMVNGLYDVAKQFADDFNTE